MCPDGPDGTVWNALVTSEADILVGGAIGPDGGGVPPSDFTSCNVKGTAVKSSSNFFREFVVGRDSFSDGWDQTALRCSGSIGPGDLHTDEN